MSLEIDLIDRQSSAELLHDADELRERMLARAGDATGRALVELRCQGHDLPGIAEITGVGVRTVQRFFKAFTEANEPY